MKMKLASFFLSSPSAAAYFSLTRVAYVCSCCVRLFSLCLRVLVFMLCGAQGVPQVSRIGPRVLLVVSKIHARRHRPLWSVKYILLDVIDPRCYANGLVAMVVGFSGL